VEKEIILLLLRVLSILQLSSFQVIKMLGVMLVLFLKGMYLQAHLQRELLRDWEI
jgi:hypothetical protein